MLDCIWYEPIAYTQRSNTVWPTEETDMMTLNEFAMFVTGVFWGIFIIRPVWIVASKIYKNAKERTE